MRAVAQAERWIGNPLSLPARRRVSRLLGSPCHVYTLPERAESGFPTAA